MAKYIIRWNAGYGDSYEVIDAESQEKADIQAYEQWREETESNADYDASEYTKELAEEVLDVEDWVYGGSNPFGHSRTE